MKRALLPCCFLILSTIASGQTLFPYRVHQTVLPNGLRVIVVPTPGRGLVSYWSVVRTGSRDEVEPGRSGYAHFFEHMMFRGTKKYPGPVYDATVTAMGADANAFTTDDYTAYHLTFGKEDLERVIEIESDRFQNLDYGREAFQTEAGAVYGEYRKDVTQPGFMLEEKLRDTAFDKHTYKHTTMGFEADVKAMPQGYEYSLSFFRRFYRPENVVLLITGDVDPPATFSLVKKYYEPWQRGYVPPKITPEPPPTGERKAEVSYPGKTLPILDMAYRGEPFDPGNRDLVAARLLAELAFGHTSDLYKKLVLDQQKVEELGASAPISRDAALLEIIATVKRAEDLDAVRGEIERTIEQFQTRPVDADKLARVKRHEKYAFLMELDSPAKVAEALAPLVAVTGGIEAVDRLYAEADRVTPEDVLRAARKYFERKRRTLVVLKGVQSDDGREDRGGASDDRRGAPDPAESRAKVSLFAAESTSDQAGDAARKPKHDEVTSRPAGGAYLPESQLVLLPVPADPTVSFRLWFKTGSQDDPPGKEGLAALTAAMLTEGSTRNHRYEAILDRLFPLAGAYSASTSVEMTVISGRIHKDNLGEYYPLLMDAVLRPAFRQEDLDRLKSETLNYLENTLRYAGDEDLGKAVLYETIFAGTPYGHIPAGRIDSVRGITLDDVRKFYHAHFAPENVVVGLGGGYDAALVEKLRGDLPTAAGSPGAGVRSAGFSRSSPTTPQPLQQAPAKAGTTNPRQPAEGGTTNPHQSAKAGLTTGGLQVTIIEKDAPATAISIGLPIGVLRGQGDWYALAVANSWFGEHRNSSSHLYQVLRDARGLNYGDYSYIEHFAHGGELQFPEPNDGRRRQIFEMWIRPVPNDARHFALRAALRELKQLVDRGLTQREFEQTKNFLGKYVLHFAPTTMDRLGYALDDRFYRIQGSHLDLYRRHMHDVTLAEVNTAVKQHLQCQNLQIVIVTKDAKSLKDALVADSPSPITYPTPKPASVLKEDAEISRFPLKIKAENVRIVRVERLFQTPGS